MKDINPLVSVIVPVYKCEIYISRCVDSVLAQSYSEFELILTDDGSPDATSQILDEYAFQDDRVICVHQKNSGVSGARNRGLDVVTGEFLCFVDADDYVEKDAFEEMKQVICETGADLVKCNYSNDFVDQNKTIYAQHGEKNKQIIDRIGIYHNILLPMIGTIEPTKDISFFGSIWAGIYRTSIVKASGLRFFPQFNNCEDWLFNIYYMNKSHRVAFCDSILYHYTITDAVSQSKKCRDNMLEFRKTIHHIFLELFPEYCPSLVKEAELLYKMEYDCMREFARHKKYREYKNFLSGVFEDQEIEVAYRRSPELRYHKIYAQARKNHNKNLYLSISWYEVWKDRIVAAIVYRVKTLCRR